MSSPGAEGWPNVIRRPLGRSTREEETYVPPPIMNIVNPADQIASAQTLLDSGAISQTEFDQLKQKALT